MNQPFNPYQHNVDILRGFFRKPIILITALTFCVPTICKIVTAVSSMMISFKYIIEKNENVNLSFSIDISSLAFLFAFIMLFCTARSRRPIVKLKPPVTFLRVLTIIFTAFTGISLAVSLILVILLIVFGSDMPEDIFRTSAILLGITFISTLCEFIFFLASCKLTKGIKYSLSSVFITKAGAKATAVSGFVYAVISVISSVIGYMFISGSIDALFYFATQISATLERSGVNFSSNFVNNSELFDTVTNVANTLYPITLVCGIIELIPFIFVSIVALMYFNYIKKTTDSLVLSPVDSEATRFYRDSEPVHGNEPQMPFNQNNGTPFAPPVVPNNQPIDNQPSQQFVYENPYASNRVNNVQPTPQTPPQDFVPQPVFNNTEKAENNSAEKICAKCGKQSPVDMNFCPYCGNKF